MDGLAAYEAIIEREAVDEFASWPQDETFATMPSMTRITLNVILYAVFGAEGQELERLREILSPGIKLGSKLALIPVPQWDWGRWSPTLAASIPIASFSDAQTPRNGFPTAAESADASALLSRPWRYASSCELCCATTSSALPTLATKAGNRAGWR